MMIATIATSRISWAATAPTIGTKRLVASSHPTTPAKRTPAQARIAKIRRNVGPGLKLFGGQVIGQRAEGLEVELFTT
jgi:hypothetical protein